MDTLQPFLAMLATVGVGILAWWIVDHIKQLNSVLPEIKRVCAIGVAVVIAILIYLLRVWLGYLPTPVTPVGWVEGLFDTGMAAFGAATAMHLKNLIIKTRKAKAVAKAAAEAAAVVQ